MKTREEIVAWLDELERVIDKCIEAMDASTTRIEQLEAALQTIADAPAWGAPDRWETTPSEVREIARAALDRK
jgi:hypothetical protein